MPESEAVNWEPCSAGVIVSMADRLRVRRRWRRGLTNLSLAVACLFVLAWMSGISPRSTGDTESPLGCSQVLALQSAYKAGTLSAEQRRQVELHLEVCPGCREHFLGASARARPRRHGEAVGALRSGLLASRRRPPW